MKTFIFGVDCTDEDTAEITLALEHSVRQIFPDNVTVKIFGQCTDNSGGGILKALLRVLQSKGLTRDHCLIIFCTLHNLQTYLRNTVTHAIGEGGFVNNGEPRMNCLQMIHGAYNIQN